MRQPPEQGVEAEPSRGAEEHHERGPHQEQQLVTENRPQQAWVDRLEQAKGPHHRCDESTDEQDVGQQPLCSTERKPVFGQQECDCDDRQDVLRNGEQPNHARRELSTRESEHSQSHHEQSAEQGLREEQSSEPEQYPVPGMLSPEQRPDNLPGTRSLVRGRASPKHDQRRPGQYEQREQEYATHRERLGERKRGEQTQLGGREPKDGQEADDRGRHRRHHSRCDLCCRTPNDDGPGEFRRCLVEVLADVLDKDDADVDHRPDRDRNATERHDVGVDTRQLHRNKCREHAQRQHQRDE